MTIKGQYLTLLGMYINGAIDSGKHISVADAKAKIEDGTIFAYLRNDLKADVDLLEQESGDELIEHWQSLNNGSLSESDFRVSKNGLNLWLAYVLEELSGRFRT